MPKARFFNLSPQRQNQFIDVALEEFGSQSYDLASIVQIAKALGIAKSNVYHYFENKKDLYFYLIDKVSGARQAMMHDYLEREEGEFFDNYLALTRESYRFELERPLECRFLDKVRNETNETELGRVQRAVEADLIRRIESCLSKAIEQGRARCKVESKLAAYLLVNSTLSVHAYLGSQAPSSDAGVEHNISVAAQIIEVIKRGVS
ncbi:TetR/AcrR family transcriptional regulator [Paraferrimonas sedimenticola]|uniref:AcrR family transcriptional regulator n=1 Tax=Paraferrimonas sedimenticola TaxID=375674 RepID=A0AA37W0P1_9GAMM|nr:TetR/AcrR family transcriptional regulator [Paraferrimonas sedimenticola]GLP95698.1 AcrR family transcriptional regulator [Paraferrimonas sedimenticola]